MMTSCCLYAYLFLHGLLLSAHLYHIVHIRHSCAVPYFHSWSASTVRNDLLGKDHNDI